jgi:hypothetical protein
MNGRFLAFAGGAAGAWRVTRMSAVAGEPLATVERVAVTGGAQPQESAGWVLRGATSNERYLRGEERAMLAAVQPPLGRPAASEAALIPIRKSAAWWALAQDERRAVLEERSRHIATGLRYLPAIARRLHHCRDLGEAEPFDFLTWFEYAPADAPAFDALLAELRATEEWRYVEREVDVRLTRA